MDNRHKNARKGDKNFKAKMYKSDEIIDIIDILPFERAWYSFLDIIPRIGNKFIKSNPERVWPDTSSEQSHQQRYFEVCCDPDDYDWVGFSNSIMQIYPFQELEEEGLTGSNPYVVELFNKLKQRGYVCNSFEEIIKKARDYHVNQEPYDPLNRFHKIEWTLCDTYSPVTIIFQN